MSGKPEKESVNNHVRKAAFKFASQHDFNANVIELQLWDLLTGTAYDSAAIDNATLALSDKIPELCFVCGRDEFHKRDSQSRVLCRRCVRSGGNPIRNEKSHIGRNDPCLCGSGKRYKACCLKTARHV